MGEGRSDGAGDGGETKEERSSRQMC